MIARAEAGQLREGMSVIDAAEIVREIVELYDPVAEDRGLVIQPHIDAPLPLYGSRELIGQAVANLIDNALKYGASSSEISVRAIRNETEIVIEIADRGEGIPESDRTRVTERFVRLETSRSQPGSGLGLSLVAAIARLHRGTLELADNHPGLMARLMLPVGGEP
jgi:signal transduction histidine kinase